MTANVVTNVIHFVWNYEILLWFVLLSWNIFRSMVENIIWWLSLQIFQFHLKAPAGRKDLFDILYFSNFVMHEMLKINAKYNGLKCNIATWQKGRTNYSLTWKLSLLFLYIKVWAEIQSLLAPIHGKTKALKTHAKPNKWEQTE